MENSVQFDDRVSADVICMHLTVILFAMKPHGWYNNKITVSRMMPEEQFDNRN